jgi:hypothetical protein
MEESTVLNEDSMEHNAEEGVGNVVERSFKVNELVEFWEGSLVRGYRTDSGAPAWVKVDYGEGFFGIKMVGKLGER